MVNPFETTSSFESLPYEILDHIAEHLPRYGQDIRQFQLLNKRCQSIAEKHLFESLKLEDAYSRQSVLHFTLFLMEPRRCKLVKEVTIVGPSYTGLNDSFFNDFCNITSVASDSGNIDWQYFHETFTPRRCKLKDLPLLSYGFDGDQAKHYCKAVEGHSQTLEYVDATEIVPLLSSSCNFPRAKELCFVLLSGRKALRDMDNAISRCPLLESLEIESDVDRDDCRFVPYVPITQHQRLMKDISVCIAPNRYLDTCKYLAAKFPNVQKWNLSSNGNMYYEFELFPFEKLMDALHLIMKSASAELKMFTEYSSISSIYGFLRLYKAHTNVSIKKLSITYDLEEAGVKEDLLILELSHDRSENTHNTTTLSYMSDEFYYLELIKKFGKCIQNLTLSLWEYKQENTENQQMLQSNALVQLLGNCPMLASFTYSAKALKSTGCIGNVASRSLKQMVLDCYTIDSEALTEISHMVPGVVDLTIDSCFTKSLLSDDKRQISINMPENSFDKLVLEDRYTIQKEDRNGILVKITSLASSEDKYYIQTYSKGEKEGVTSVSDEQEYKTYYQLPYTRIAIVCQSFKCIEYYSNSKRTTFRASDK